MANYNEMEQLIIDKVLAELRKQDSTDLRDGAPEVQVQVNLAPRPTQGTSKAPIDTPIREGRETLVISDEIIDMPDISTAELDGIENPAALEAMKKLTIARIGLGRSGTRQKTDAYIRFMADHAIAQDAVFLDVDEEFLAQQNLPVFETQAGDKEAFLTMPHLGTKLTAESAEKLLATCEKNVQVQIIVVDGLSSSAIEKNIPEIMPSLLQGLQNANIRVGKPIFIKHGRVRVMDQVGMLLNADLVIELIGERPGLGTASSMSAYLIYQPKAETVEADRTMISNIYKGGTPPVEAGAQLVDLAKDILRHQATGVRLNEALGKA